MKNTIFTGTGVAIVTPFDNDGKINCDVFEKIINMQIEEGTDAIIVNGTTGESATLDNEEHIQAIRICSEIVAKRVPVIAGTGSNDTSFCLNISNAAEKCDVDGLLLVTPYYNKTSQEGLIRHYLYIADRVSTPIIVYNVPSRTGLNILPETYLELSKHPLINGAKEANGNIAALAKTISLCKDQLNIYSGNDDQATAFMSLGAKGLISVLANVAPRAAHEMTTSYLNGDYKRSAELQLQYIELCNALFMDVNPIPVKEAMNMMGLNVGECRMPLAPLNPEKHEKLAAVLKKYNLI